MYTIRLVTLVLNQFHLCKISNVEYVPFNFFLYSCRALEFKTSKSQKKVLKRVNKFLIGQDELSAENKLSSKSNEDMAVDDEGREQFVETTRAPQIGIVADVDLSFIDDEIDSKNVETGKLYQNV